MQAAYSTQYAPCKPHHLVTQPMGQPRHLYQYLQPRAGNPSRLHLAPFEKIDHAPFLSSGGQGKMVGAAM